MLRYIDELLANPGPILIVFLLAFPGRILALSAHEFGHAWVANRCGDPTAKMLGRLTLNPLKHLDPLGTVMMLLLGFGWARPVPVNPRNFRRYRRDDLLVSLAGVTMNLILFLLAMAAMVAWVAAALMRVPAGDALSAGSAMIRADYQGAASVLWQEGGSYYYMPIRSLLAQLPYAGDTVITPVFGKLPGYLYQMLGYFSITNLSLILFNLLPIPPLDGYHVFNDLLLRRSLFANRQTARIASTALFVLSMSGYLGRGLGWVITHILSGCGQLAGLLVRALGLM